ncbi:MAG: mitochondrial fission ELM1 family protein [Alphaproteobacteria bacterium]
MSVPKLKHHIIDALTIPATEGISVTPTEIKNLRTWILSDGRTGHLNQSLGVAEALGIKAPDVVPIVPRGPLHKLRRIFLPMHAWQLPAGPYPQLLIGTGWGASQVSRLIKHVNPNTFTVQLMRPSGQMADYDVVAMPLHDNPPALENVMATIGAPNRIFKERLETEAERWRKRLLDAPEPRLALLLGGNTKGFSLGEVEAQQILDKVLPLARKHGLSIVTTTSRRTAPAVEVMVQQALVASGISHYFWSANTPTARDNPFLAYLATSQAVVVTADSVSMISEACTAGLPVSVWGLERVQRAKFGQFYAVLQQQKRIAPLADKLNLRSPAYPLADTRQVAGFIQGKLARMLVD